MENSALVRAAEDIIPNEKRGGWKEWMADKILDLMEEERRKVKNTSGERYTELDRRIKQMCMEMKEEWLGKMCEEMEHLEKADSRIMAEKIRAIAGKRRTKSSTIIKDKDGNILDRERRNLKEVEGIRWRTVWRYNRREARA